ncbi:MAG: hypothetical protein K8R02_02085 [Anaerohalosphaeraceae bacterium]|nr:hypothetical protein [Anaerohalosphaeraceae bacterium]
MFADALKHLKKQFENFLPEIVDAYKAKILREAISLLDKAESLSHRDSDRNEINRLIARALILGDEAGGFNERFSKIQTKTWRGGYKASEAGEKN